MTHWERSFPPRQTVPCPGIGKVRTLQCGGPVLRRAQVKGLWVKTGAQRPPAEAESCLAGFQEESRAGIRQQGSGSLAAGRVRGRTLPPLRVDAGEDAERLPSPAGEGGRGTGREAPSHTQVTLH